MPELKIYNLTDMDLQAFANAIKDKVILSLKEGGHLNGDAEEIGSQHIVVVQRKNLFGKFIEKFIKDMPTLNTPRFVVLRLATSHEFEKPKWPDEHIDE